MGVIDDLRKQAIPSPASPKFSLIDWLTLGKAPGIGLQDLEVIAIGVLVYGALDKLRGRLSYVNDGSIPPDTKRRALVGLANRECIVAECVALEQANGMASADRTVSMDHVALIRINLPSGDFAPGEICQTAVDGVGRLLRMCPEPDGQSTEFENPPINNIARDFNIANAYLTVEDLWLDIVWNDVELLRGKLTAFVPGDEAESTASAVAQHRHLMTTAQSFNIRFARLRKAIAEGIFAAPDQRKQVSLQDDGGSIAIGLVEADQDLLAYVSAANATLLPKYYRPILSAPAPNGSTLTLEKVLDAHFLMMSLAQRLAEPMMKVIQEERKAAGTGDAEPDLKVFTPLILAKGVKAALEAALSISPAEAQDLLDFMTFGAEKGELSELWSTPFVRHGADHLIACVHPLTSANLRWLIDVWLKQMGFPLDFRGAHFEVFVRQSMQEAAKQSALAPFTQVHADSFFFTPPGGREEEIDLVIVVGTRVIVGEVKCFLEPVSPVDRRNHREKIVEASEQVMRKLNAVRKDPKAFRDRAKQYGITIPADFVPLPVVVLNHAIGAGRVVKEVPIIDLRILEMFFEGSMQWRAIVSAGGSIESSEERTFYASAQEAEETLSAYLADPPQVRHLKAATRPRYTQILMPGMKNDVAIRAQFEIDPDALPDVVAAPVSSAEGE